MHIHVRAKHLGGDAPHLEAVVEVVLDMLVLSPIHPLRRRTLFRADARRRSFDWRQRSIQPVLAAQSLISGSHVSAGKPT
jgi:hypothetical protein